ncbi:MAG: ABC transporter permease [Dehalococcoidales bacterium]
MNKTILIFRHEFFATIRRVGFIVLTLALPILALLTIGVTQLVSGIVKPATTVQTTSVGYVDEAGGFNQFTTEGDIKLVSYNTKDAALQAMVKGDINDYFVIPDNYTTKGVIQNYTMEKQLAVPDDIQGAIKSFLSDNLLAGKYPDATVQVIESPLNLVSTRLTETGAVAQDQGGVSDLIIPGIFSLLLVLSLIFSSTYVLQGLGEEKENRIMEILLSSVSPRQLITAKVLGIGLAGLVQVVLWAILLPPLLNLASSSIGGFISSIHIPANFLILGIVYFILGYLLFAVLCSCIAAVSGTVRDAQGMASIFTIFSVAPFWFLSLLILFPGSPVWIVFSIFPFSAPVMMMLRFGMYGVPVWQIIVSIAVMILFIAGGLVFSAKLLRTYLLMYGKRPKPMEILKNLQKS